MSARGGDGAECKKTKVGEVEWHGLSARGTGGGASVGRNRAQRAQDAGGKGERLAAGDRTRPLYTWLNTGAASSPPANYLAKPHYNSKSSTLDANLRWYRPGSIADNPAASFPWRYTLHHRSSRFFQFQVCRISITPR